MPQNSSVPHQPVLPRRDKGSQPTYLGVDFWIHKHFRLGYTALAEVRAARPEQTGGIAKPPPVASRTISCV
jgi:hypothetical protein